MYGIGEGVSVTVIIDYLIKLPVGHHMAQRLLLETRVSVCPQRHICLHLAIHADLLPFADIHVCL